MKKINNQRLKFNINLLIILLSVININLYPAATITNGIENTYNPLAKKFVEAARSGNIEEVKRLINLDVNVNVTNDVGETALTGAATNGHKQIVELLLNAGAEINKSDGAITALIGASFNGYKEIVELLLIKGANVNYYSTLGDRHSVLIWASRRGQYEVVKLLLDWKASVNYKNRQNETALIEALRNNQKNIVELLINSGADVDAADLFECTPLMIACFGNGVIINKEIIQLLLRAGADIEKISTKYQVGGIFGFKAIDIVSFENPIETQATRKNKQEVAKILNDEPERRNGVIKRWIESNVAKKITESSFELILPLANLIAQYATEYTDIPMKYRLAS